MMCNALVFVPADSIWSSLTLQSSEMLEAIWDNCFTLQSICSVIALHSSEDTVWDLEQEVYGVWIVFSYYQQ